MIAREGEKISSLIGREEILTRLEKRLQALKKGYRQNLSLIGPPFIGKTLLVRHFLKRIENDSDILPIYIALKETDFDEFLGRWLGGLLEGFLASKGIAFPEDFQSLMRVSKTYLPKTLERMREVKKHAFQKKHAAAFRELLGLTSVLREETGKKVLLILDEFHRLDSLELSDPFDLFSREMMVQKDTLYLVTSSDPRRAKEIFHKRLSLLFGNFEILDIGMPAFDEVRQWVADHFSFLEIPEKDLRLLDHFLGNHPGYFELFFREAGIEWLRSENKSWDHKFLFRVLEESLFSESGLLNRRFESRLQDLLRFGRQAWLCTRTLVAIASGRSKLIQISAFLGKKGIEVKKLLQRLVQEGFLVKRGSFHSLPDPLFRFWLRAVYQLREKELGPGPDRARAQFKILLLEEIQKIEEEERKDFTARMEELFREFRNDMLEVCGKTLYFPSFIELASRPTNGRFFPLVGRTVKGRWFCQVFRDRITETDVQGFSEEARHYRKGIQRKVMVALGGMEMNAKLLAQEGKIQIWDLDTLNALLELYGKRKVLL